MSETNTGGPEFPQPPDYHAGESRDGGYAISAESYASGMTLRDYFAAQAMVGIIAAPGPSLKFKQVTASAYEIADSMLKAREVKQS